MNSLSLRQLIFSLTSFFTLPFNDKSGEFDDEMYSGDEPKTNEEMQLILKGQEPQFALFTFTNQILKNIQTFNYTKAFELVNKCSLCFKVNKYY